MLLSEVHLIDNIEFMRTLPDNYFDLVLADPPYGIGEAGGRLRTRKKHVNHVKHKKKDWDKSIPSAKYFDELRRVSVNQVIFGANYFTEHLPPSMGWIFWDKLIGGDFSDGELVYTSFNRALKKITINSNGGNNNIPRLQPAQKPIKLYKWILQNYAKPGDKIFDPNLGSGSSRIAAFDMGFNFVGTELDKEYFDNSVKRFEEYKLQLNLFR